MPYGCVLIACMVFRPSCMNETEHMTKSPNSKQLFIELWHYLRKDITQTQAVEKGWSPFHLAAVSLGTVAAFSLVWMALAAMWVSLHGEGIRTLWRGSGDLLSWGMLLLTAIGPWGSGGLLQLVGQARVPPSEAQIILALSPVCATVLAYSGVLGADERAMSVLSWIGMGCILTASLIPPVSMFFG